MPDIHEYRRNLMPAYTVKQIYPGSNWTVMKNGQVYSGPYVSKKEAELAAKNAAKRNRK